MPPQGCAGAQRLLRPCCWAQRWLSGNGEKPSCWGFPWLPESVALVVPPKWHPRRCHWCDCFPCCYSFPSWPTTLGRREMRLPLKAAKTWLQCEGFAPLPAWRGLSGLLSREPEPQPSQYHHCLHGCSVGSCGVKDRASVGVLSRFPSNKMWLKVIQCHVFFNSKVFWQKNRVVWQKIIPIPMSWSFPHTTLPTDLAVMLQHINGIIENNQRFKKKNPLKRRKTCSCTKLLHLWTLSFLASHVLESIRDYRWPCKCVWGMSPPWSQGEDGGKRQCMFGKGSITYLHILLRQMAETVAKSKWYSSIFFPSEPCWSSLVLNGETDTRLF